MTSIIVLAILGGIGISLSLSIIGNFIVWKKLSFISDSISHSSILGIVIGVVFSTSPDIFVIIICFLLSVLIVILNNKLNLPKDALLVIITQLSLSLGAVIFALFNRSYILTNFFFGNLLGITIQTIVYIFVISFLIVIYTFFKWNKLLLITINPTVAKTEGIAVMKENIFFMFLFSCTIAYSIKFVGILLIPSLVVIPAIISSLIAKTPLQAIIISFISNCLGIVLGILGSAYINVSIGPLITLVLVIALILTIIVKAITNKIHHKQRALLIK